MTRAARGRGRRLSDAQRLAIIDELSRPGGPSNAVLAARNGISAKTVRSLWKQRELPSLVKVALAKEVEDTRNGAFGFSHGRPPTLMDAAELTVKAWDAVSAQSIQNCFIKANIGVNYTNITTVPSVNAVSALVNNAVNEADGDIDALDSVVRSENQTWDDMISLLTSEIELDE